MIPSRLLPTVCALLASFLAVASLSAQQSATSSEDLSLSSVLGREIGERITQHHEMTHYLRTVAEASDRVVLLSQGTSWEGRELLAVIVTSPENHRRLEEIRARSGRLADPRSVGSEPVEAWIGEQPIVLWMGGSIHGNELSGSEAMLRLLERLATARDEETARALDEAVVIIDPMINPDGRDAFAQINHRALGATPNADSADWSNDYRFWQSLQYRTGHYYFDTNRDWFAQTQRETRHRVATMLAWNPQIVVDAHEMGSDAEFYFDPPAAPLAPVFPGFARRGFELFGRAYAAAFDAAGYEYMTGERFNYFYPGYTTSYGSFQGAVGMLFEQGSTRGLALERPDGSVRRLRDAVDQQWTAAWTTVRTAVENREALLKDYAATRRTAVEAGRARDAARRYFLPPGHDPGLHRELAETLARNGIELGRLTGELRAEGLEDRTGASVGPVDLPAGTLVVETGQPRNALLRVLLEPDQPLPSDFLQEARQRLDRGENPRFYDITSWSLPLLFDQPSFAARGGAAPEVEPFDPEEASAPVVERAGYAYLLDGEQAGSMAALHELRRAGYRAAVLLEGSRQAGRDLASGTVILRVGQNPDSLHDAVREAATRHRVAVRSVDSGLAERGFLSLGSGSALPVRDARIALLAEGPVHGYSFGWAWYVLDRQYGIPTTVLRVDSLGGVRLSDYDVLVIPDLLGDLGEALGETGLERLKTWVRDGGTLVAVGAAVDFAASALEALSLKSWYPAPGESGEEAGEDPPRPIPVPGAVLDGRVNPHSWLAAGLGETVPVLANSSRVYLPPAGPRSPSRQVAVSYPPEGDLTLAGHTWQENRDRLAGAVFAYTESVGRGQVVAFVEDPNFRGYFRGADRLFLNAVVLGPSAR